MTMTFVLIRDMSKWDCFVCWLGEPYTVEVLE